MPHIGCPQKCSFCNRNTITGSSSAPTLVDVKHAVETALLKLTMSMKLHFSAVRLPRLKGRICFLFLKRQSPMLTVAE